MKYPVFAFACLFAALLARPACAQTFAGQGVVVPGTQRLQAFARESAGPGGSVHVDMWEVGAGRVVQRYDVDMTKLVHLVVVSDDLRDFQHIHPVLQADGHFTIDIRTAERGLYHLYYDGIPHGFGRAVFRFDLPIGTASPATARFIHAQGNSAIVGPYTVTLDPVSVPFGEIATIAVTITKNGKPATDLHPYLGAMAHGIFIGTGDLAYMHAHGMAIAMLDMASSDCGDSMMLTMPPLPPGSAVESHFAFDVLAPRAQSYDFWLQFTGGSTLYTAPFLVTAR